MPTNTISTTTTTDAYVAATTKLDTTLASPQQLDEIFTSFTLSWTIRE